MKYGKIRHNASVLIVDRVPLWRSNLVMVLLGIGYFVLCGYAFSVQVFNKEVYQTEGEQRFVKMQEFPAQRGRILDRNGVVLATSVRVASISANPAIIKPDQSEKFEKMAELLEMPYTELQAKLFRKNTMFVQLKNQLPWSVSQSIMDLEIQGIQRDEQYQRLYPEGETAVHVVGIVNTMTGKAQEGMELALNAELTGRHGSRRIVRDKLNRVIETVTEEAPRHGKDVYLSIDSRVQFVAWQKLRDTVIRHQAKAGSVVVLDARTGEVLALVNYPSYDPQNRVGVSYEHMRNRAVTDVFEPGSIIKPITVGMALELGRVRPDTVIDTAPGFMVVGDRTIRDTHNNGSLSVEGIIQKSSNIGVLKVAQRMSPKEMWTGYTAVGYGQKPQIELPGAISGRLRPWRDWRPVEQATMAYGYGLSASLLQMARSYTVFAGDGALLPVSMRKITEAPVGAPVFSPGTIRQMRHMLELATLPNGGTGSRARVQGYAVGGKSGTARKHVGTGYSVEQHRAWFTGIAPIDDPRIVVAVLIDEPSVGGYYGGVVAAPVFSEVVRETLRLVPSLEASSGKTVSKVSVTHVSRPKAP